MFIKYLFNRDSHIIHQLHTPPKIFIDQSQLIGQNIYDKSSISILVAKKEKRKDDYRYKVGQNFTDAQMMSPNFVQKLINKYWQETIFLSVSNPLSENYINQLKSIGIAVYQKDYKKFLLDFSKALTTGRIETSLNNVKSIGHTKINPTHVKYIWRKGFNFSLPENLIPFFLNKKNNNFLNSQKLTFINKLKENDFPLFTVVNGFNQIVMAESSEEILDNKTMIDRLYQYYYNRFLWTKHYRPLYEGLFFVNPEDAIEYKNHIRQKYPQSSKQNHLKVFASKLDLYYKLTSTIIPKAQFRLIPDLTELGELIFKYNKYRNIRFHHQQKYGKNYFQGQPIYLIQPVFAFNKKLKKVMPVDYSYKLHEDKSTLKYEAVFINYKTALLAWQKFRQQAVDYTLPKQPSILVYNLEDFMKTCEYNDQINKRNILFIPSQESYTFLKKRSIKQSQDHLFQKFSTRLLYLQVLSKRILWSLTSRQPMNW